MIANILCFGYCLTFRRRMLLQPTKSPTVRLRSWCQDGNTSSLTITGAWTHKKLGWAWPKYIISNPSFPPLEKEIIRTPTPKLFCFLSSSTLNLPEIFFPLAKKNHSLTLFPAKQTHLIFLGSSVRDLSSSQSFFFISSSFSFLSAWIEVTI